MATSLGLLQNLCQIFNPHTCDYLCWRADEDWSSSYWDIRSDMPIFAVQQGADVTLAISGVTGPNVTKIVHNVEKFILFNILKSELWYCNLFQNGSATKRLADFSSLIGCHGNHFDKWQNKVLFRHRHVKCCHTVKRLWTSVQYIRRYSTKYVELQCEQQHYFDSPVLRQNY